MKINHKTLSLIIASLCGTCISADLMGQDTPKSVPKASSGRIGDVSGAATPAGRPISSTTPKPMATYVESTPVAQPQSSYSQSDYAANEYDTGDYQLSGDYGYDPNASDFGYSSGYEYNAGYGHHNLAPHSQHYTWVEVESLLWWGKSITNTPQILQAPAGAFSFDVASGGESNPLGQGLMPGMRGTIGTWLDNDQNYALTGSVFGLFTGGESNTFGGGSGTTGVSFFRPDFGPDAYLVNYSNILGYAQGTVTESSDLDLLGADLSLRTLLIGDSASRADFILGYTFNRLDSSYGLKTHVTDHITNTIPDGTIMTTSDFFRAKNEFHGIHLGLGSQLTSGRFTLDMKGKVALSHLTQRTSVSGKYTEDQPGLPLYTENRGLFAQPGNSGSNTDRSFSFLPEINTKLKYQLGRGQIGVGYSLLMLPKVVMASSQIDHTVDVAGIGGVMTAPNPSFQTETFFLHGLDLGYTLKF